MGTGMLGVLILGPAGQGALGQRGARVDRIAVHTGAERRVTPLLTSLLQVHRDVCYVL